MTTRTLPALVLTGLLGLGLAACDGNAQDDLDAIESNVEEGVEDVGEAIEEGGEEIQENSDGS